MSQLFIPQVEAPTTTSKEYPKLPANTYLARVVQIIDLGTQPPFDATKDPERKFRIVFETVEELFEFSPDKGLQPYTVDKDFPYKISKPDTSPDLISNLTKLVEAVNGNRDDKCIYNLINKLVQITVIVDKNGYNKITTFSGLSKSLKNLEFDTMSEPKIFSLDSKEFFEKTKGAFDSQPQFVKNKIEASPEWQAMFAGANTPESKQVPDDQLPEISDTDLAKAAMPY